jgi:phosphatidylethanolamine/phosphatidyl-N-methylethanolamine N-methyltransferase
VTARKNAPTSRPQGNGALAFFLGFLRNPNMVGSLIPSSRFLERRLVQAADVGSARLVVELGPGTGGTTRALLAALPANAKLLAIELNARFATMLRAERDPRLIVYEGSAADLADVRSAHGLGEADAVISGIPFSTMPPELARRIMSEVWASLAPGGRLVAYQVRSRVADYGRETFGEPQLQYELRNAPPIRIYVWRRRAAPASA